MTDDNDEQRDNPYDRAFHEELKKYIVEVLKDNDSDAALAAEEIAPYISAMLAATIEQSKEMTNVILRINGLPDLAALSERAEEKVKQAQQARSGTGKEEELAN